MYKSKIKDFFVRYFSENYFYLSILLVASMLSLVFYSYQSAALRATVTTRLTQQQSLIKQQIEQTNTSYKSMLDFISKKIIDDSLINEAGAISLILKNAYIANKNINKKIGFLDISWYNSNDRVSVNRYGAIQITKAFPVDFDNNIKTFPNKIHLYAVENTNKIPSVKELYLAMGVTNTKGQYLGKLIVLLDTEQWVNSLKEKFSTISDAIIAIDSQYNILFSTEKSLENLIINVPVHLTEGRANLSYKDYIFSHSIQFNSSPYMMLLGYNKKSLEHLLIQITYPTLFVLWGLTCFILALAFLYKKQLRVNIKSEFIKELEKLKKDNIKLTKEQFDIVARMSKELDLYIQEARYNKDFIEAYKLSEAVKEKLITKINSNIVNSLTEIRELIKILIHSQQDVINISISPYKQIEILSNSYNKLAYISEFCAVYKQEEVEVNSIICEVIKVYAKDIFPNNLSIIPEVSSQIKTIQFNRLLFQQIMASLLYTSIECSKPNGKVIIEANKKKVNNNNCLVMIIKDDGFQLSSDYSISEATNISPLKLDFQVIKGILETHNGTLDIQYNKEGKAICLVLPLNTLPKKNDNTIMEGSNVVLFKKP